MAIVTINVDFAWDDGQDYYILADQGFVVDADTGTPSPAITSPSQVTFTTLDKPGVDYSNINDGETYFKFRERGLLTIDFDQPVTAVSGKNIYVYNGGTLVDTIAITSADYNSETYTFTVETNVYLDPEITYTCYLEAGGAKDANNFTCVQTEGTVTHSVSSSLNDTYVLIDYGQAITKNTGNIYVYTSGDALLETIDVTSSRVTIIGNTLKVQLSTLLPGDVIGHYALTDAGIVEDSNGFNAPAITSKLSPEVDYTVHYSTINGNVIFDFDRNVYAGTGEFHLYTATHTLVASYDVNNMTFTGNKAIVNMDLIQGNSYYVKIDAGSVVDIDGLEFDGEASTTEYAFTVDNGPTITAYSPVDGATSYVPGAFSISFNQNVINTSFGDINLYKTAGDVFVAAAINKTVTGNVLNFEFDTVFLSDTDYYIKHDLGLVTDASYNFMGVESIINSVGWNFTTATGANISTTVPADNATNVTDLNMQIVFDDDCVLEPGSTVEVYRYSDDQLIQTVSLSQLNDTTLLFTPSYLDSNEHYYVLFDEMIVVSTATNLGNPALTDKTVFDFTTGEIDFTNFNVDREYNTNISNQIFNTYQPVIVDDYPGNPTYEITVSSTVPGKFYNGTPSTPGDLTATWNYTGSKENCNTVLPQVNFYPDSGVAANGTLTITVSRDSTPILNEIVNLSNNLSSREAKLLVYTTSGTKNLQFDDYYYGQSCDMILVGGGGGAGGSAPLSSSTYGGAGGGGGVIEYYDVAMPSNSFSITVGAGGTPGQLLSNAPGVYGTNGGDTIAFGYTAGGGGAGGYRDSVTYGNGGGSGSPQSNLGGYGAISGGGSPYVSGGGGGAGSAAGTRPNPGPGITFDSYILGEGGRGSSYDYPGRPGSTYYPGLGGNGGQNNTSDATGYSGRVFLKIYFD